MKLANFSCAASLYAWRSTSKTWTSANGRHPFTGRPRTGEVWSTLARRDWVSRSVRDRRQWLRCERVARTALKIIRSFQVSN